VTKVHPRAPTVLLLVLLAAAAAALANTQRLKVAPDPISVGRSSKVVSPECGCKTDRARIAFRLQDADTVTVSMLASRGPVVQTLAKGRRYPAGGLVRLYWNGRFEDGRPAPEGRYRVRVELEDQERTIVLPRRIELDSTPPQATLVGGGPRELPPDARSGTNLVALDYRFSEPAYPLLLMDGRRRGQGRTLRRAGRIYWRGRVGGGPLERRTYRLQVRARDSAGNLSAPTRALRVGVRVRR
jgi:hypothetical protein